MKALTPAKVSSVLRTIYNKNPTRTYKSTYQSVYPGRGFEYLRRGGLPVEQTSVVFHQGAPYHTYPDGDELWFHEHCLESCGQKVWTREELQGKTEVLCRHGWLPVVRVSPKTISVENPCYPKQEHRRRWPLKYLHAEVRDAR